MKANVNAIVIVIDRLGAGLLGPYGNTWSDTPAFNQLAAQAMLFENAYADAPGVEAFYRAVGSGRHGLASTSADLHSDLTRRLAAANVQSVLVTDFVELGVMPFSHGFADRIAVPLVERSSPAETVEETQAAHTFAAALECLDQIRSPSLLWVHLRGLTGLWDAPREFRERFADEEDPTPPDFVQPPDRWLPENVDPDEILGVSQAYAGQVALNDLCLSTFLEEVQQSGREKDTLLIVTSPAGYALGEHGGLGPAGDGLFEETLHLPLFLRRPDRRGAMQRVQSLVGPIDIHATIAQWFQLEPRTQPHGGQDLLQLAESGSDGRQYLVSAYKGQRSLRTRSWFVTQPAEGGALCYVKPDDRWEVNEIGSRRGDIVEQALQALTAFEDSVREGREFTIGESGSGLLDPVE